LKCKIVARRLSFFAQPIKPLLSHLIPRASSLYISLRGQAGSNALLRALHIDKRALSIGFRLYNLFQTGFDSRAGLRLRIGGCALRPLRGSLNGYLYDGCAFADVRALAHQDAPHLPGYWSVDNGQIVSAAAFTRLSTRRCSADQRGCYQYEGCFSHHRVIT
jgi:hypothetical protein